MELPIFEHAVLINVAEYLDPQGFEALIAAAFIAVRSVAGAWTLRLLIGVYLRSTWFVRGSGIYTPFLTAEYIARVCSRIPTAVAAPWFEWYVSGLVDRRGWRALRPITHYRPSFHAEEQLQFTRLSSTASLDLFFPTTIVNATMAGKIGSGLNITGAGLLAIRGLPYIDPALLDRERDRDTAPLCPAHSARLLRIASISFFPVVAQGPIADGMKATVIAGAASPDARLMRPPSAVELASIKCRLRVAPPGLPGHVRDFFSAICVEHRYMRMVVFRECEFIDDPIGIICSWAPEAERRRATEEFETAFYERLRHFRGALDVRVGTRCDPMRITSRSRTLIVWRIIQPVSPQFAEDGNLDAIAIRPAVIAAARATNPLMRGASSCITQIWPESRGKLSRCFIEPPSGMDGKWVGDIFFGEAQLEVGPDNRVWVKEEYGFGWENTTDCCRSRHLLFDCE